MASERQWDTDWMDQFKSIFPTNLSTLSIYPGEPLSWVNVVPIPFGNKQAQRGVRRPDQTVQIKKEIEYVDKYARREVQVLDMPSLTDRIRIKEEYYAGDTVNALGHVNDLFQNFKDALNQFIIIGTASDPLSYGLIDVGAGTGSTTLNRPDACDQGGAITTAGAWTTQGNMMTDFAKIDGNLVTKGFTGAKIIGLHPVMRPFLSYLLSSVITPYNTWIDTIAGYQIFYSEYFDADATSEAFDLWMFDKTMFDIYMTPMRVRGFFDNNTEDFVWNWQTRAIMIPRVMHDGTDYLKGCQKMAIDWTGA